MTIVPPASIARAVSVPAKIAMRARLLQITDFQNANFVPGDIFKEISASLPVKDAIQDILFLRLVLRDARRVIPECTLRLLFTRHATNALPGRLQEAREPLAVLRARQEQLLPRRE